jgi:hypothetical protein
VRRAAALFVLVVSCRSPAAVIPYHQDFGGPLGREWQSGANVWHVEDGRLRVKGARNEPLWLDAALPDDVRVRLRAESMSDAVDIKFEVFGDGERHQSGYVVILAGWNNSKSIIARLDEHGPEQDAAAVANLRAEVAGDAEAARLRHAKRREIAARREPWQKRRVYELAFERRGHELILLVDGAPYLSYYDASPLRGRGHDRFALNDWQAEVAFDDLTIEPLGP